MSTLFRLAQVVIRGWLAVEEDEFRWRRVQHGEEPYTDHRDE